MPVKRITRDELKLRLESEGPRPTVLDARLKYPYEHSTVRLPGATRIQPDSTEFGPIPQDRDVVVYDSDPDEVTATRVAVALIGRGYRVSVLEGGAGEWITANFPVEPKTPPAGAPTTA